MIGFRKSTLNDREALLNLIDYGFASEGHQVDVNEGLEHRALFLYLYTLPGWNPEWVQIAEEDGKILAAAGYFPQSLSLEDVVIAAGAISPVVTLPEYRSQGLARKCLERLMKEMAEQGIPVAFLWGLPNYYPKLGFVPILPRYKTKLTLAQLRGDQHCTQGKFRECRFEDLDKLAEMYASSRHCHWFQPIRDLNWWKDRYGEIGIDNAFIKEVPFPKKENLLVWENNLGELSGYLNYSAEYFNYIAQSNDYKVVISESAAKDINSATGMIKDFLNRLLPHQTLYIRGTPDHTTNIAAYHLGGTHINPAPLAGMIKIIDWSSLLIGLNPLFNRRISNQQWASGKDLNCNWSLDDLLIQMNIQAGSLKTFISKNPTDLKVDTHKFLTRLFFGLYQQSELESFPTEQAEFLQVLFPQKYPFIWDANYLY